MSKNKVKICVENPWWKSLCKCVSKICLEDLCWKFDSKISVVNPCWKSVYKIRVQNPFWISVLKVCVKSICQNFVFWKVCAEDSWLSAMKVRVENLCSKPVLKSVLQTLPCWKTLLKNMCRKSVFKVRVENPCWKSVSNIPINFGVENMSIETKFVVKICSQNPCSISLWNEYSCRKYRLNIHVENPYSKPVLPTCVKNSF